jgi:hypothetical protein
MAIQTTQRDYNKDLDDMIERLQKGMLV